jgi:DNA-binding MarR family transcriptional regulator
MDKSLYFPLYDLPAHLIRRAKQSADAVFDREMAGFGITPAQLGVLIVAGLREGLEQRELAAALSFDPATTAGILSRLDALGYIERRSSPRSRRGRVIFLTGSGKRLSKSITPHVTKMQRTLLERLTRAESRELLRLLSKMLDVPNNHYRKR